jgi:RNA 3'-terminal phosphate cyclase (ATP)
MLWEESIMIEIDGSYGEGGGQVLRTALTLSSILGKPTRIYRIRARRRNPGLAPQHLTNVHAAAQITGAHVTGAAIGSTEVLFRPGTEVHAGSYAFDVSEVAKKGSAGSVTLILQTLLLPLALSGGGSRLLLKGGTHVPWSPPFEFLTQVYFPALAAMKIGASVRLEAHGFYPAGGGRLVADIMETRQRNPAALQRTRRGSLHTIGGQALACNLPVTIPQRMVQRTRDLLEGLGAPVEIATRAVRGAGPGAALFLTAEYEDSIAGFSALGQRGKRSEQVAEEACRDLMQHHASGAPVDEHLADQLMLPMALAEARSELHTSRISRHLLTCTHVIRQFLPVEFRVDGAEGRAGTVVVSSGSGR